MTDEAANAGMTSEEVEKKKQARLERFGKDQIEESEKSISKKGDDGLGGLGGFKPNRRK